MNIYTQIEKTSTQKAVALGLFDGVHIGHREVIKKSIECKPNLEAVALTFNTSKVKPSRKIEQKDIMNVDTRLSALAKTGLDSTYIIDFDDIKEISADDFIKKILHETLNAKVVCCGADFRFGKNAKGDVNFLLQECPKLGMEVHITPDVMLNGDKISSTRIRKNIMIGDMEKVSKLLGYRYFIKAKVVYGKQLGRTISCPTINQDLAEGVCIPRFGVYISKTEVNGVDYPSITNVGIKPTIDGDRKPLAETHIIGLNKDLYGKELEVRLYKFIRDEQKFNSIDELAYALKMDIQKAKAFHRKDG